MPGTNRFSALIEGIKERASIKTVFGEPISRGDRTVVPVARILFGFGGGEGEGTDGQGAGMGGGGTLIAQPLGVYEITDEGETRFLPLNSRAALLRGIGLGLLLGLVVLGLLRRLDTGSGPDFSI